LATAGSFAMQNMCNVQKLQFLPVRTTSLLHVKMKRAGAELEAN